MNRISAQIIADSKSPQGDRITTYILKYPRIIHAELMTHRMFSRNSASSRAIPFDKMIKMVEEEPFIPIAFQKEHKGMQGSEYITNDKEIVYLENHWLDARDKAVSTAYIINGSGNVTKQLCNRLLEPFMYHTILVTATEWNNFFDLRCPKYDIGDGSIHKSKKDAIQCMQNKGIDTDIGELFGVSNLDWIKSSRSNAEIHIQDLAEKMWDAYNESKPKELKEGEWHIPFGNKIDPCRLPYWEEFVPNADNIDKSIIKIATARCARLSYMTFDNEIDYEKDIKLHDQLLENHHYSPFEHCARVMSNEEYFSFHKGEINVCDEDEYNIYSDTSKKNPGFGWCNNFKGFIPYRYLIENNYD